MTGLSPTPNAIDKRARAAAMRSGLVAQKSRWRANSCDNYGGYMLIEPSQNRAVDGVRYDLSAEEVIARCADGGYVLKLKNPRPTR